MHTKSNVLPFKAATRPKRLAAAKSTRLTSVCYKASDKGHTSVDWYTPPAIVKALGEETAALISTLACPKTRRGCRRLRPAG